MSKHTYGFPAGTKRDEAVVSAVEQARAPRFEEVDGEMVQLPPFIGPGETCSTEIVETDAHRANGEFCVVVRGGAAVIG